LARDKEKRKDDVTPGDYMPTSTPDAGLGGRHDQTQVLQILMEIHHDLGRLTEKVEGIAARHDRTDDKVSKLNETVIFVKGALYVGGPLLAAAILMLWWFVGDQVSTVFKKPNAASAAAVAAPFPPTPPAQLPSPNNLVPPAKK
jgi:hypothetical protein